MRGFSPRLVEQTEHLPSCAIDHGFPIARHGLARLRRPLPAQQPIGRHSEEIGQTQNRFEVRFPLAVLVVGDRPVRDPQNITQVLLGKPLEFAGYPDPLADWR